MKKNNLDITISSSIILVTVALILYGMSESGFIVDTLNRTLKEYVFFLF